MQLTVMDAVVYIYSSQSLDDRNIREKNESYLVLCFFYNWLMKIPVPVLYRKNIKLHFEIS
jgi:hypothetical protein